MEEKQILEKCRRACIYLVLLINSCATLPEKPEPAKIPRDYWLSKKQRVSPAKRKKIQNALNSVLQKALATGTMDEFGVKTMRESIVILERTAAAAPFIAEVILLKGQWAEYVHPVRDLPARPIPEGQGSLPRRQAGTAAKQPVGISPGGSLNGVNPSSFWKFRFWCVDMAGYLKNGKLAQILYSVVADRNERLEIRMRAVVSLREMKKKPMLKKLFLKTKEVSIREEVAKAILYLSR